jgi:hypothetical protein
VAFNSPRFALPRRADFIDRSDMGLKYVPSIKDQKAGQRFQQKQQVQSKFIKPAPPPARQPKKK